ncbi:MAG: NapC/NirT family cytochrome c [Siculibacillus sp.]|nr:NapC/NirT family cytochrome c [Siculibacillus sp.]
MTTSADSDGPDGVPATRPWWVIPAWVAFGIVVGIVGWGGFNTAMEATNSLEFCISCHEMRSTVHEEYKTSVHHANASGVRAVCSDCHVPKDWTHKLVRKIRASGELWAKLTGTIDTPEKFEARRLALARHEWARMRESDSRECRNCHSFEAMDFHKQRPKSAEAMKTAQEKGHTCIDCHKGIAHKLPDLTARHREMARRMTEEASVPAVGATVSALVAADVHAEAAGGEPVARIAPGMPVRVLAREGERIRVEAAIWQREGTVRTVYAAFGRRITAATVVDGDRLEIEAGVARLEPERDETWTEGRLRGWTGARGWVSDAGRIEAYGTEMYDANCSFCHALPNPEAWDAEKWISHINAMRRMVPLEENEISFLLGRLQRRAKDAGTTLGAVR